MLVQHFCWNLKVVIRSLYAAKFLAFLCFNWTNFIGQRNILAFGLSIFLILAVPEQLLSEWFPQCWTPIDETGEKIDPVRNHFRWVSEEPKRSSYFLHSIMNEVESCSRWQWQWHAYQARSLTLISFLLYFEPLPTYSGSCTVKKSQFE